MGSSVSGRLRRGSQALAASMMLVATFATVITDASPASASPGDATVVVEFAPGTQHAAATVQAAGVTRAAAAPHDRYVMQVPAQEVSSVLSRFDSTPGVRFAEVARPVHAAATPNDPCDNTGCPAADQSGNTAVRTEGYLSTIGAPQAWDVSKGDGVTVAVLDSGVDPSNPDLQGKIVAQHNICGADLSGCGDTNNNDDFGHGTHVSGIVAADTDNGIGVASLGWNVKLDEYKVLNSTGGGNTADVATAIYDAVAAGDRVINMSLANLSPVDPACQADPTQCGPDPDEETAVEYAIAHNVVVVAAAGNDGYYNGPTYPASYPGVLSVAATDNSGAVQPFSEWGSAANIAAPGLDIVSTWPTYPVQNPDGTTSSCLSLCVDTGTSMAAPQVSAAAALLISHNPALSGPQITELLEASARPTTGGHTLNGGLLDVPAALAAEANPPHSYLGYEMAGTDGSVYSFGSVGAFGSAAAVHLARPIVGTAMKPDGLGYWLVASDGGVFTYGTAGFYGSTGGTPLNKPVVGMAATPDGRGYWLVASDGGVFAFGDAGFYGSTGGIALNKPVVGMAATPDGRGYWMVASDGGIFAYGDAGFRGSAGSLALAKPVVAMTSTPDGQGYWLFASDGGVFNYGDARFYGSTGGSALPGPVVSAAS